jgi:hypothetical protein
MGQQSHPAEYRGCSTAGRFSSGGRRINHTKSFDCRKMHSSCSVLGSPLSRSTAPRPPIPAHFAPVTPEAVQLE